MVPKLGKKNSVELLCAINGNWFRCFKDANKVYELENLVVKWPVFGPSCRHRQYYQHLKQTTVSV